MLHVLKTCCCRAVSPNPYKEGYSRHQSLGKILQIFSFNKKFTITTVTFWQFKARISMILLHKWLFKPTRKSTAFRGISLGASGFIYRGFSALFFPGPISEGLTESQTDRRSAIWMFRLVGNKFFSKLLAASVKP